MPSDCCARKIATTSSCLSESVLSTNTEIEVMQVPLEFVEKFNEKIESDNARTYNHFYSVVNLSGGRQVQK